MKNQMFEKNLEPLILLLDVLDAPCAQEQPSASCLRSLHVSSPPDQVKSQDPGEQKEGPQKPHPHT